MNFEELSCKSVSSMHIDLIVVMMCGSIFGKCTHTHTHTKINPNFRSILIVQNVTLTYK